MGELVQDAENLLDFLKIKSCLFIGLSIGGMIGQSLAFKRPDLIEALVLSNTTTKFGDTALWEERISVAKKEGIEGLADAIMQRWFAPEFHQNPEIEAWRNLLVRTPQEGYIGCSYAISETDLANTTSTLKLPTLCIAGEFDGSSPPAVMQALNDLIVNSRMVTIENAGHLPCVEKPEIFAQHLNNFMREINFV